MKRNNVCKLWVVVIVVLIPLMVKASMVHHWAFETTGDNEGWEANNDLLYLNVENGSLRGEASGPSPQILYNTVLSTHTKLLPILQIKMTTSSGTQAKLEFTTTSNDSFDVEKEIIFPIISDQTPHIYNIDTLSQKNWKGTLGRLRITPILDANSGDSFAIEYIRLIGQEWTTAMSMNITNLVGQISDDYLSGMPLTVNNLACNVVFTATMENNKIQITIRSVGAFHDEWGGAEGSTVVSLLNNIPCSDFRHSVCPPCTVRVYDASTSNEITDKVYAAWLVPVELAPPLHSGNPSNWNRVPAETVNFTPSDIIPNLGLPLSRNAGGSLILYGDYEVCHLVFTMEKPDTPKIEILDQYTHLARSWHANFHAVGYMNPLNDQLEAKYPGAGNEEWTFVPPAEANYLMYRWPPMQVDVYDPLVKNRQRNGPSMIRIRKDSRYAVDWPGGGPFAFRYEWEDLDINPNAHFLALLTGTNYTQGHPEILILNNTANFQEEFGCEHPNWCSCFEDGTCSDAILEAIHNKRMPLDVFYLKVHTPLYTQCRPLAQPGNAWDEEELPDFNQCPLGLFNQEKQMVGITNDTPPRRPIDKATLISQSAIPSLLVPGEIVDVTITFKNDGETYWSKEYKYRLGSDEPENNNFWGLNRLELPKEKVWPGEEITFAFSITAPSTPGIYACRWRMLREETEEFWFDNASQMLFVNVGGITPSPTYTKTNTPTPSATPTLKPFVLGDVNCDDTITPADALLAFQFYLKLYTPQTEICDQFQAADWDNNGSITPGDALCIFRIYLQSPC